MTWSGDMSKMGQLVANIGKLARVPARASKRVAREIRDLIEEQFEVGADPYGNAWKELAPSTLAKRTQITEPPLTDTGDMRSQLRVEPMRAAGVSITIPHPSEDHQTGWSGPQGSGPARPILPAGTMPARWGEAIRAAARTEFASAARGAA